MELRVITLEADQLEVEVLGENETLLNPIKQALLEDKDVDFAEYIIEHPMLSVPKVFLRTTGKADPSAVLLRTVKAVSKEFDEFETAFAKALKSRN